MREKFELYESVRIKADGTTGVIVSASSDNESEPSFFFVEKDDEFKSGDDDCIWVKPEEIEHIDY